MKPTVDQIAHDLIRGERAQHYGPPHINFEVIANLWTAYLRPQINAILTAAGVDLDQVFINRIVDENDVANLMTLLKIAREATGQGYHEDSTVDAIGYQIIKQILTTPIDQFIEEMNEHGQENQAEEAEDEEPSTIKAYNLHDDRGGPYREPRVDDSLGDFPREGSQGFRTHSRD